MRLINGHFTVVNEQDNAKEIAKELLVMFESDRSVDQLVITREMIEKECHNSNNLLLGMIETYIAIVEEKFNKLDVDKVDIKYPSIEKAQLKVVEATRLAERNSTKHNWKKLDVAQKNLTKELNKAGFTNYTLYADSTNVQGSQAILRKELILQKANYLAQRNECLKSDDIIGGLTPDQVVSVISQILANRPKTGFVTLPIVFDDALRGLNADTKLRALELLKRYSNEYATWYVSDDPIVLRWSGFQYGDAAQESNINHRIYDFELDIA